MKKVLLEKDSYFDSVFLMLTTKTVKETAGVLEAVVAMGTDINRELLIEIGFSTPEVKESTPNDLIIAIEGESAETIDEAIRSAKDLLKKKQASADDEEEYRPVSLDRALKMAPDANLVIISVPGAYAAREARKALENGRHVMIFSDNVALEDEIALKKLATEKGLLVMGPDCGTALINGKPLCFANAVTQGDIGIVAASGTGLQEVSSLIDRFGGGVSQAIGTGGRDLRSEVGGMTMLMGIEALKNDPQTRVITVVSKPPAEDVAATVLSRLKETGKPCVVHFIGLKHGKQSKDLKFAGNLEEAAGLAVASSRGEPYEPRPFSLSDDEIENVIAKETGKFSIEQKYLRGLYTGGTLADEAMILLEHEGLEIYSNLQGNPELTLKNPQVSQFHTIVDLGDDTFTVGRPHPMIDPTIREERIFKEAKGSEVAVVLLDLVLGNGSHEDPGGAILESLKQAKKKAEERGGYLSIIASITGTVGDFQDENEQKKKLESIGCIIMPSNYQASMLALKMLRRLDAS